MESYFPESNRTYAKVKEGKFCFADMHISKREVIRSQALMIKRVQQDRKQFVKVIWKVRLRVVIRYLLGRMDFARLQQEVKRITDSTITVIILDDPRIAMDIDKPHQLDIARTRLSPLREMLYRMYIQDSGSGMSEGSKTYQNIIDKIQNEAVWTE